MSNRWASLYLCIPPYLETADYAAGRKITVVGLLTETHTGTIGEGQYVYPVVEASRIQVSSRTWAEARHPCILLARDGGGISRALAVE